MMIWRFALSVVMKMVTNAEKQTVIENFILYAYSEEKERERMNKCAEDYISDEEEDEYFHISSLSKEDLLQEYDEDTEEHKKVRKLIKELTDDQMEHIARKMSESYCDCCYWTALKDIFESWYLDEVSE